MVNFALSNKLNKFDEQSILLTETIIKMLNSTKPRKKSYELFLSDRSSFSDFGFSEENLKVIAMALRVTVSHDEPFGQLVERMAKLA